MTGNKEETVHFSIRIVPIEGYKPIEEFMGNNLAIFESFAGQLIQALADMNFTAAAISKES